MNSCLPASDFEVLGREMLAGFDQRIARIPDDLCAPFQEAASQLEAELLMIYKMVALCARREEDLQRIAMGWTAMVRICDDTATHLSELCKRHPNCGADPYYDNVLDLRNKCQRLAKMHL